AHQDLSANDVLAETFTVTVTDDKGATTTQDVTITISGTNDAPVISVEDLIGAVTEQVSPVGSLSDSGVISFTDVDLTDVHLVSASGTPVGTTLGALTAVKDTDTTGTGTGGQLSWTYTVDAAAVEFLAAGQQKVEGFTITLDDQNGVLISKQIDVTITGTNDAATVSSETRALTETNLAADINSSGTLVITDPDTGEAHSVAQTATAGTYGTFDIDTNGNWTYSASSAHDELAAGQQVNDTFTVRSQDGTASGTVLITITGTNDAAIVSGTSTGAVIEAGGVANAIAGTPTATGTLTDTDVDNPANTFTAVAAATTSTGGFGTYTMTSDGVWTYTLNNANTTVQALNATQTLTDTFTVTTVDGTAQLVTVTINGSNDAALISGTSTGSVIEAGGAFNSIPGTPTATGTLTDTDVDNAANTFTAVAVPTLSASGYGSYTMSAGGVWTYTLDNTNPAVEALSAGQTLNDTFTVNTVDGTAQLVSVTINGADDAYDWTDTAAVLAQGYWIASVNGTAFASLADSSDQTFTAAQGYKQVAGSNGTLFVLSDGTTKYRHDGSASTSDSFTYTATDGVLATNTAMLTITVGTNTAPTLGSTTTFGSSVATVAEDTQVAITFDAIAARSNEADDVAVTAFVVKSVTTGTLLIGTSAATATAWASGTNDTIDGGTGNPGGNFAFWTGAKNASGGLPLNAFSVVARDGGGLVSDTPVQVRVQVNAINDAPLANDDTFNVATTGGTITGNVITINDVDPDNAAGTPAFGLTIVTVNGTAFTSLDNSTDPGFPGGVGTTGYRQVTLANGTLFVKIDGTTAYRHNGGAGTSD
ncbi:MAG: hypothetical protein IH568_02245, partial [Burkholderiaceae bacterium]|nr:hypothetical protein [Burkholderiaceae bacterium]